MARQKLILVHGGQGSGKSSVTNALREKMTHTTLMRLAGVPSDQEKANTRSLQYHMSMLEAVNQCYGTGMNFIFDRSYLCEKVYANMGFKGHTLEESANVNFGMTNPEGYRKALRLMRQAEKFDRPIITFVDTPGAYPGVEAEEHGQGEAIARNLAIMSGLKVPIISIIIGQGNSGGALGICVADEIWMLENSVFSILSPEGFASILWKDSSRRDEACELMKLTAQDLYDYKIIDGIINEPKGGAHMNPEEVIAKLDEMLYERLNVLSILPKEVLIKNRYKKYRVM